MACDVEVQDAPAIMANNEEAVEKTEGDRRNGEEIHGGDGFAMMAEKSQPPPTRFWISGRSLHPAGDASLRNIEAEHQKFAVDAGATPAPDSGSTLRPSDPSNSSGCNGREEVHCAAAACSITTGCLS